MAGTYNNSLIKDTLRLPFAPQKRVAGNFRESTYRALLVSNLQGTATRLDWTDDPSAIQALLFVQDEPAVVRFTHTLGTAYVQNVDDDDVEIASFTQVSGAQFDQEGFLTNTASTAFNLLSASPTAVLRGSQIAGTSFGNVVPVSGYTVWSDLTAPFGGVVVAPAAQPEDLNIFATTFVEVHTQSACDFGEATFATIDVASGIPTLSFIEVILAASEYTAGVQAGIVVDNSQYQNTFTSAGVVFRVVGLYGTGIIEVE